MFAEGWKTRGVDTNDLREGAQIEDPDGANTKSLYSALA